MKTFECPKCEKQVEVSNLLQASDVRCYTCHLDMRCVAGPAEGATKRTPANATFWCQMLLGSAGIIFGLLILIHWAMTPEELFSTGGYRRRHFPKPLLALLALVAGISTIIWALRYHRR